MSIEHGSRREAVFTERQLDGVTASWRFHERRSAPQGVPHTRYVFGASSSTRFQAEGATPLPELVVLQTRPQAAPHAPPVGGLQIGGEGSDSLLCRLRGRRMVQWMAAYLALAWLVLQVVDVLGEVWAWPLLVQRAISLALGVGVLPASVLAWYHGEKGRQRVCGMEVTLLAATLMGLVMVIWSVCFSTLPAAG